MKKLLLIAGLMAFPLTATAQTLLSEDFQTGSFPAGWTIQQTNNAETWHVEDLGAGAGDYRATVNYDPALNAQDEKLVMPSLNLSGGTAFTLKAKIGLSYYWSVDPNNFYDAFIKVSIDDGSTWTQVWSENDLGVFANFIMNPVTVDLSSFAGNSNVKIAFQYVGLDGAALYLDDVSVFVPPTTPPNCAMLTSPADAAVGISYPATTLSWTAPSGGSALDSYDVYLDENANPTTLLGNTTALTYSATGLNPYTTYYWKVVPKNGSGPATGCTVYSFTTAANPFAPYCGPLAFTFDVEPITLVNFAGINNTSSATVNGSPGHEDFISMIGNVTQGDSYPLILKGNTAGNYTSNFVVFIDWNQNGVLDDAGEVYSIVETIKNSTGTDALQATATLAVPADAAIGNTRMRVKKMFGTTNIANPCAGELFGQAEDYTINVTALGVSNVNKSQVKVYPNPVVDVLNIEADFKVNTVQVFDLTGKVVSSHTLDSVKNQVNLSKLTPGVYVVNIQTEKGIQSVKIVKK